MITKVPEECEASDGQVLIYRMLLKTFLDQGGGRARRHWCRLQRTCPGPGMALELFPVLTSPCERMSFALGYR